MVSQKISEFQLKRLKVLVVIGSEMNQVYLKKKPIFILVLVKYLKHVVCFKTHNPPIYLNLMFTILQLEISSLMNWIFIVYFKFESYKLQHAEKSSLN